MPSHDTFYRVFAALNPPQAFAQHFGRWMAAACEATALVPIAIDGKDVVNDLLDVVFREDESRTCSDHAGENLGMIRRVALCLLKRAGKKGSMETRRLRAGWDQEFLLQALQGIPRI